MSRLIVKNLPNNITEDKLRETFSTKGTVTDIQLKYTKSGKFRHFGFIGFKSEDECKVALEYFNNTYLNATKIKVELCANLGDPSKPKSWSKYSSDSFSAVKATESNQDKTEAKTIKNKKNDKNEVTEILEKHKDDPLFAEFMETHMKKNKTIWSNDTALVEDLPNITKPSKDEISNIHISDDPEEEGGNDNKFEQDEGEKNEHDEVKSEDDIDDKALANQDISDMEYLQRLKSIKGKEKEIEESTKVDSAKKKKKRDPIPLFTLKIQGLGFKARKSHVRHFFHPIKPYSIRLPPRIKGIAYVGFRTEKEMKQALAKNKGFLSGRQIMVTKTKEEEDAGDKGEESKPGLWKWKDQEESLRNEETIGESGKIFVRNLAHTITEEDVEALFSKYGPLAEVNVPVDWITRKPKGFGTVTFMIPEHAVAAFSGLDGTVFQGRMLHLLPGKAKPDEEDVEGLNYKQKKAKNLKDQAKSSHNWNTLFLGQNAVVDAIARAYDTTKEKVLDSSQGNSVAVRLALGETQLVNQTRDFLIENGVSLSAFDQAPKKRSKTVLLVKNLPAGTEHSEIRAMFEKHALLGRVILPPSGLTAIVEFNDPAEARTAFRKLAYTKFKSLPLYLEWAPEDTFTSSTSSNVEKEKNETDEVKEKDGDEKPVSEVKEEQSNDEDEEVEPDSTLFVKNLNFNTREKALTEHFKKCGKIYSATIAVKKDAKKPGELLSMGYGFVQFMKKSSAEKALKTLQNSILEGHAIELKRSNRMIQSEVRTARKKSSAGKQTSSKILVRNIPFQATQKEVTELFQTFGELKSVRLPKKLVGTGSHRGFGFVEYLTKADAKQAFKALSQSTHLFGRRLVLEWASNEEDVEELRKRTAKHFNESAPKASKKSVFNAEPMDDE